MALIFVITVFIGLCYLFNRIQWLLMSDEQRTKEILQKQELALAEQERWQKVLRQFEQRKKERLEKELIKKIKQEELHIQYRSLYPDRFSQLDQKLNTNNSKKSIP